MEEFKYKNTHLFHLLKHVFTMFINLEDHLSLYRSPGYSCMFVFIFLYFNDVQVKSANLGFHKKINNPLAFYIYVLFQFKTFLKKKTEI